MADVYRNIITGLDGVESTVLLTRVGGTNPSAETLAMEPVLEYKQLSDPREVLRISTLIINAVVKPENNIEALFTEESKQWEVFLYRNTTAGVVDFNTITLFHGWLQNDTIQEDFVKSVYSVNLRASDGLAELANQEYLDENGNLLTGVVSLRQAVNTCINRIGINNGVWYQMTDITIDNFPVRYFVNNDGDQEDFWDIKVDQRTFRRDADKAVTCKQVLEQILTLCNGFMYQYDGQWWIFWRLYIPAPFKGGIFDFTYWDPNVVEGVNIQQNANVTIGDKSNGFTPFWANENQIIQRRASLSGAKIYYKYGNLAAINNNAELDNDGFTLVGWTVNQPWEPGENPSRGVQLNPDGTLLFGLTGTPDAETDPALTGDPTSITYDAGGQVQVELAILVTPYQVNDTVYLKYRQRIRVTLSDGATTYYLDSDGRWSLDPKRIAITADGTAPDISFTLATTEPTPIDGELQIFVYPVDNNSFQGFYLREARINFIKLGYIIESNSQYVQESHTVTQNINRSPVVYEPKTVNIGPWLGSRFVSSLLTALLTELEFGFLSVNPGYISPKGESIFEIAMRDSLAFESKIGKDFSGDIFGYIPIYSKVSIDGFPGSYMIAGYSYNVIQNTISLSLFEVFFQEQDIFDPNPWWNTISYRYTPGDTGETIKPAIRG